MSKTRHTQADNAFRDLLKKSRLARNLTQTDLSKRLGLPQSFVSKYESGERRLDFVETLLVCEALKIRIQDFASEYAIKLAQVQRAKGGVSYEK